MSDTAAFTLNVITLGFSCLTCLITFIVSLIIFHHLRKDRTKAVDRVTMVICATIYPIILLYSISIVWFNLRTLLGDLYQINFDSVWCTIMGYISPSLLTTVYWVFLNQAIYRLCRIVYSNYRWLQAGWVYVVLFIVELIFIFILLSPVLIWNAVAYLPAEHYCYVPFRNLRGILWLCFNAYGNPVLILMLIYIRLTIFLRNQSQNQTSVMKKRQERDLIVIRRIFIIVTFLLVMCLPALILLIMLYITGEEYYLLFRIEWLTLGISLFKLSISLAIFTPRLKSIVIKTFFCHQIQPIQTVTNNSMTGQRVGAATTSGQS